MKAVLARFGESVTGSPKGAAVRLSGGRRQLAEVVRALDAEDIEIQELQLHAPTLDDVFLAKTGRSLEGADARQEATEPRTGRVTEAVRGVSGSALFTPGGHARPPLGGAHAAPAGDGRAVARASR